MIDENIGNDPYLKTIAGLTIYEPDPRCANRIRARCHAQIAGQKRAGSHSVRAAAGHWRSILEPSLVIVVCAVYLCEVLRRAVLLYGF